MMNIREYFENLMNEMGMDEAMDFEQEVFEWYCNDDERFDKLMEENNIDLNAVEVVLGGVETVLTLWVWDMCGD